MTSADWKDVIEMVVGCLFMGFIFYIVTKENK